MYTVTSGIVIQFAHHVRGHDGPCISLHGHTWKFEVAVEADVLDAQGFVIDFDRLHAEVLEPCHALLDHGLAVGEKTWDQISTPLAPLGEALVASRMETIGSLGELQPGFDGELHGARNERPGGIKVAVFPFNPTSERLAQWLYEMTAQKLRDNRVRVARTRIFETLHPTELYAEYVPGNKT